MRPIPAFLLLLFTTFFSHSLTGQNRCAATEIREEWQANYPNWQNEKADRETILTDWINENRSSTSNRTVVTIPVVVHVVWNSQEENIPDEQIHSQIAVLNEDFRKLNVEIPSIPADFQALIADVEFEFYLAQKDPSGASTTGITRTFTNNPVGIGGTEAIHYTSQGGKDAWDTERYLNIWVAKFAGGIGGISSFPGVGPAEEDGVEINYLQFGNINVSPPYHLGRTLTHEIGHYFNLEHPWGPSITDCCEDDFVDDTPESCETYIGECPSHPAISCSMPDMFMNFMFYTNDECMGMFSIGQKMRMWATLNTMRQGLLDDVPTFEETDAVVFKILNNPAKDILFFEIEGQFLNKGQVMLTNLNGAVVLRKEINHIGQYSFKTNNLPSGVYFLIFGNERMNLGRKVFIN